MNGDENSNEKPLPKLRRRGETSWRLPGLFRTSRNKIPDLALRKVRPVGCALSDIYLTLQTARKVRPGLANSRKEAGP